MNDEPNNEPQPDWWETLAAIEAVADSMLSHTLYLGILTTRNGELVHEMFSGSAILYRGYLLWLTAGHCLSTLGDIARDHPEQTIAKWCVFSPSSELQHPGFPVDLRSLSPFFIDQRGVDFGVACIPRWPSGDALLTLADWHPLEECDLHEAPTWEPEGFYLVGAPQELSSLAMNPNSGRPGPIRTTAAAGPLPVRRVLPPIADVDPAFYENEGAFFGQLSAFDAPKNRIQTILGMSGGPLFGVTRDGTSIQYKFCGIQSAWMKSKRLIRATPRAQIRIVLDAVV